MIRREIEPRRQNMLGIGDVMFMLVIISGNA